MAVIKGIKYKEASENFLNLAVPSENNRRSSIWNSSIKEFFLLRIEDLIPYSNQARKFFSEEEMMSLKESIEKYGIRQPLTVMKSEKYDKKFEIISGERRWRAAKLAGLEVVPCIIMEDSNIAQEIAIVENIHREDLHPIELALALDVLMKNNIFKTQVEVAESLSITKSKVSELMKLIELPKNIIDYLINKNIRSRGILRNIIKNKDNELFVKKLLNEEAGSRHPNTFSVFRVDMVDDNFIIRYGGGFKKLTALQKIELQKCLKEMVE